MQHFRSGGHPARTAKATQAARAIGAAGLGLPLLWISYSALLVDHNRPLPAALDAERRMFTSMDAGRLSYYTDTSVDGRLLVLVHSINVTASAYEMRPLFDRYRKQRPVYALDLPGFGFSERSDREYSPELYTAAIVDFLRQEVRPSEGVDLVALSLSSEFAARAAYAAPTLVRSLALISPTGFTARDNENQVERSSRDAMTDRLYRVFSFPLWRQAFYDLLATEVSIRYFLGQLFVGPVDDGLVDYTYVTSHRPGARYAPLYFVSGKLFTPDIRTSVYERLEQPVLVLYDQDPNIRFDMLPDLVERRDNWSATRITPSRGLPHWEQLEHVVRALDGFFEG